MASNTYVALSTQTVTGSAASTVSFTSIPQGYTDLFVVCNFTRSGSGNNLSMRINGDTATNYSETYIEGDGSSAFSGRNSNTNAMRIAAIAGGFGTDGTVVEINLQNYSNTTTYKSVLTRYSQASTIVGSSIGLWRSTSAITSIELGSYASANFAVGSTFTLYGIAAASVGAKATGGTIYQDASYFYHVFTGNGTFTPSQSISADILCVAGGGGGSTSGTNRSSGGGGAGGLLGFASQSLTATGYSITVGAGGATSANGVNSQFAALTASVGGGRGGAPGAYNANSGGSGGGGADNNSPGTATSGQGSAGGNGYDPGSGSAYSGGGGGGATAVGGNASANNGGAGGTGSSAYSSWSTATGISSTGVFATGGRGGSSATTPANGESYTGNGGTGGFNNGTIGTGGSGVVIVRYAK